jgi:ABC-type polysaccharide/polyol phosphate export permease
MKILFTDVSHGLQTILSNRYLLGTLIWHDFKSRYLSSYIGLPWAFVQPAVYVLVVWFAFTYGLRAGFTSSGVPFGAWLIAGLIPWLFISQTMIVSCLAITEYGYLIKKTQFPVLLIPIIKIFSGMIVHAVMMGCIVILLIFSFDITPTIYWIQIFYYLFAMLFLLSGVAWLFSAINVFIKDMAHIVNILTTIMFWSIPIIWPYTMISGSNLRFIALLNPFFYITEGYRYTFIEQRWFFEFPEMNIFFWTISIATFVFGLNTFRRLRPGFGDEL